MNSIGRSLSTINRLVIKSNSEQSDVYLQRDAKEQDGTGPAAVAVPLPI